MIDEHCFDGEYPLIAEIVRAHDHNTVNSIEFKSAIDDAREYLKRTKLPQIIEHNGVFAVEGSALYDRLLAEKRAMEGGT